MRDPFVPLLVWIAMHIPSLFMSIGISSAAEREVGPGFGLAVGFLIFFGVPALAAFITRSLQEKS